MKFRSTAVGLGSTTARIGSIITPYTLQLQDTIPWLTSVFYFYIITILLTIYSACLIFLLASSYIKKH